MKVNIKKFFGLAVLALIGVSSCQDPDYMKYDGSFTGVYFTRDTLAYSFGVTPVEVKKHVFKVPVQIMGLPVSYDREIQFELIPDSCKNAVAGVHYNLGKAYIPGDSINGYIPVEFLRDALEGSYPDYTHYQIGIRLVDNEHFHPTLSLKDVVRVVKFDNAVSQPDWLSGNGQKVWPESLGTWHPFTYIKLVEYFHAFEAINPVTYKKIAAAFGENLEHIQYGDPYPYTTTFRKYMYTPLYEYINDPAHRDYILGMYPDYPFDMPNPNK